MIACAARRPSLTAALAGIALGVAVGAVASPPAQAEAGRAKWNTRVLALVPRPGFPALAYVAPNGRIYEGTYANPQGSPSPSRVLEYDGDGTLLRSWTIDGQNVAAGDQGVQAATSDAQGRLVLLDKDPARALLLDPRTGTQTTYASFPNLPGCGTNACTAVPDYAAWGTDGSLYVTDYQQGVVWRVPPGGGTPQVWLADARLNGMMFGTAGISLAADRRTLLISQQSSAGLSQGNPSSGRLFSVPIGNDGRAGPLTQLWESGSLDAPDGFAIAQSGHVYIALLLANQILEINAAGQPLDVFPAQKGSGANGSPVPFDSPSSVRFLGDRLIVAAQSYAAGNPANQAIFDVEAGELGLAEFIPSAPGASGAGHRLLTRRRHRRHHRQRRRPRHHRRAPRHPSARRPDALTSVGLGWDRALRP